MGIREGFLLLLSMLLLSMLQQQGDRTNAPATTNPLFSTLQSQPDQNSPTTIHGSPKPSPRHPRHHLPGTPKPFPHRKNPPSTSFPKHNHPSPKTFSLGPSWTKHIAPNHPQGTSRTSKPKPPPEDLFVGGPRSSRAPKTNQNRANKNETKFSNSKLLPKLPPSHPQSQHDFVDPRPSHQARYIACICSAALCAAEVCYEAGNVGFGAGFGVPCCGVEEDAGSPRDGGRVSDLTEGSGKCLVLGPAGPRVLVFGGSGRVRNAPNMG